MKKCKVLLAALLAVAMMASLCACMGGEQPDPVSNPAPITTTTTTAAVEDGKETYKVTVLDEAGAPVVGAFVQLCKETCIPCPTDANGVATWAVEEDDEYKVSFAVVPAGYEVEEAYYFEDDATEMTITIKKAA